ncbi:TPA: hypothetical protein L5Q33_005394 [Pseudomonas aeruginosa]|nr:hypothetical protein [Pseudomonas aeruginosa]
MSLDEYNDKLNFLAACTAVNVQQQRSKPWLHFLSCLYGSERARRGLVMHSGFLSCLYGSERVATRFQDFRIFLSCLYGSEPHRSRSRAGSGFLSCLYGSEQAGSAGQRFPLFLSCLYGSELAPKTYNHLKEKEIPSFSCQKPSFFEVS